MKCTDVPYAVFSLPAAGTPHGHARRAPTTRPSARSAAKDPLRRGTAMANVEKRESSAEKPAILPCPSGTTEDGRPDSARPCDVRIYPRGGIHPPREKPGAKSALTSAKTALHLTPRPQEHGKPREKPLLTFGKNSKSPRNSHIVPRPNAEAVRKKIQGPKAATAPQARKTRTNRKNTDIGPFALAAK